MTKLSRIGQQALDSQPFSRLIRTKLVEFSEEETVLEIPIREELLQQNGFVHGGVSQLRRRQRPYVRRWIGVRTGCADLRVQDQLPETSQRQGTPREGFGDPRQQAAGRVPLRSLRHRRGSLRKAVRRRPGHYRGGGDRGAGQRRLKKNA